MTMESDRIDRISNTLEARVASFVTDHRLPGVAAGVVVGDELAWSFGFGYADVDSKRPSGPTDLYRIASITKTFTATAIMQLRDDGKLHLDDPVVRHLPELASVDPGATSTPIEAVTVRRLLSHESGLMSDPPGTDWSVRRYETDVHATLARAAEIRLCVPPNTQTKYSNLAFQLLGEIVARCSGVSYEEHVRTRILEPLGMDSTEFDPPSSRLTERCATGYAPRVFSDRLEVAKSAGPPHSAVAEGGLWSSVEDLARWISVQLAASRAEEGAGSIVAGSTLREMHRPRYLSDETWTEAFGIGWYARRRGEDVWVQHSGGLPGFITNAAFHAEFNLGVIVLLNGLGGASELATDLGSMVLEAVKDMGAPARIPAPLPERYAPLLGLYMNAEMSDPLRVEWRDDRLTLVNAADPSWHATLTATDDPLVFTIDPGIRESGEPAIFGEGSGGHIRSLMMASDTLARVGPVPD